MQTPVLRHSHDHDPPVASHETRTGWVVVPMFAMMVVELVVGTLTDLARVSIAKFEHLTIEVHALRLGAPGGDD